MIALDINSNYSDRGGGIRTYHRAKAAWFDRQRRHRYYLIVPGATHRVRRIGPRTVRIDVFGLPLGGGYRLLLDYLRVLSIVRRAAPARRGSGRSFLDGHLLSGHALFGFVVRPGGLVLSFRSDRNLGRALGRAGLEIRLAQLAGGLANRAFYAAQRRYDITVVTSRTMEEHLSSHGVQRLVRKPFGADPVFFLRRSRLPQEPPRDNSLLKNSTGCVIAGMRCQNSDPSCYFASREGLCPELGEVGKCHEGIFQRTDSAEPPPSGTARVARLLFVGRLGPDKGADLLLRVLPRLMSVPGVQLTVVGSGPLEPAFAQARYRGLQFEGYVRDRDQLAEIYAQHQVLLAPGPYETFGLAVLEAMAGGLVVVGPDRGGTSDLLSEVHSPFVFRAGEAADFLRAIDAVLAADLAPHVAAAEALARRYGTWDEAIGRLVSYYESSAGAAEPRDPAQRWRLDSRSADHLARPGDYRSVRPVCAANKAIP